MTKLVTIGRSMFAVGIIALGFLCIVYKDFIIARPPAWPEWLALNPALAYVSALIIVVAGISILINKKGGVGALIIALLILVLSVFRYLPQFMDNWVGAYKSLALVGGSLLVACSFFLERKGSAPKFLSKESLQNKIVFVSNLLLTAFFVAAGYAHFKFVDFVISLIPEYIPFRSFFVYFTGICLLAGGVGILIPPVRKWAALLSGIMVFGWFLLLHIPRFTDNMNDASDRMGVAESFAFAGIFFVLAGIFSKR